jgi:hypothetical protein
LRTGSIPILTCGAMGTYSVRPVRKS